MKTKNQKATNRRYYLHRKIKQYAKLDVFLKQVSITHEQLYDFNDKQTYYLNELSTRFGYNLQTIIPN